MTWWLIYLFGVATGAMLSFIAGLMGSLRGKNKS